MMRKVLAAGLLFGLPMIASSQASATWWEGGYYDRPVHRYYYAPRAYGYYDEPRVTHRYHYYYGPRVHRRYNERDWRY